jgi:hypothetical protein
MLNPSQKNIALAMVPLQIKNPNPPGFGATEAQALSGMIRLLLSSFFEKDQGKTFGRLHYSVHERGRW